MTDIDPETGRPNAKIDPSTGLPELPEGFFWCLSQEEEGVLAEYVRVALMRRTVRELPAVFSRFRKRLLAEAKQTVTDREVDYDIAKEWESLPLEGTILRAANRLMHKHFRVTPLPDYSNIVGDYPPLKLGASE